MPRTFYEEPTDDAGKPKRFCDGLREDLKYCLVNSDCVQKVGALKLRFSSANKACLFYQTPPLLPYLDAHYSTRSTTNAICLPR